MKTLKNLAFRWGHLLAAAALFIGSTSVNVTCSGWVYQPKVPAQMNAVKHEALK